MKKVLLITLANHHLGYFHKFVPRSIPLGVAILGGFLIENGKDVEILDEEVVDDFNNHVHQSIQKENGEVVVGISSMTPGISKAYDLAKEIKTSFPQVTIVFGGIHPTVLSEEVLETGMVDFVIRGEGEIPFLSLLNSLEEGKADQNIPGLSYLNSEKTTVNNPKEQLISDLDIVPPLPYHLFEKGNYDLGFVLSSRGCPFDCIFCSQRVITERAYRYHSTERVIDALKYLIHEKGQTMILFFDDFLTGTQKRLIELCEAIKKEGLHKICSFGGQTRGDGVNEEILSVMKSANFTSLMFGVETASEYVMSTLNKKETVQQNIDAILLAKEMGFTVEATFIFGFAGETFDDRFAALKMSKDLKIDRARFNNATPYPGTQLFTQAENEGRLKKKGYWTNFSAAGAATARLFDNYQLPYVPEGATNKELQGTVLLANLLFYINLGTLKKLFNFKKEASGKWFEMSYKDFLNLPKIFSFLMMIGTIAGRFLYYLVSNEKCRKFFVKGIKIS